MANGYIQVPSIPNGSNVDNYVTDVDGKKVFRQRVEVHTDEGQAVNVGTGEGESIDIVNVGDEVKNQEGITYQSVQDAPVADHMAQTNDLLQQILFQLQYMNDLHGDYNG